MTERSPGLEFRMLGPLEVVRDGRPVPLASAKARAILGLLLLDANRVVAAETLIDELWGDEPPRSPRDILQVHVSNLRKSLSGGSGLSPIVTRPPGYALETDPDQVDLWRFERLQGEASAARAAGHQQEALRLLREALALWRGAPLADVQEPFADAARTRLEEARVGAFETLVELELEAGRHADAIPHLRAHIASYPYRERFRAQLMVALYRSGRQAEALEEYHAARRVLDEDLGIEPGAELRGLQQAILRQEPQLAVPPAQAPDGEPAASGSAAVRGTRVAPRRPLGRRVAFAAVITAGLAVALGVAGARDLGGGITSLRPGALGMIDPSSMRIVGQVPTGTSPGRLAAGEGSVWVTNEGDRTLSRVDLVSRRVSRTYGLESVPTGIAAVDGSVWVVNGFSGTLSRLLVEGDVLTTGIRPRPGVDGGMALAAAPGALWAALRDRTVVRIDPASGTAAVVVRDAGSPEALATGAGAVWLIADNEPTASRIDPAAGMVAHRTQLRGTLTSVAVGTDAVWVTGTNDNRVWRIDPVSSEVVATIGVSDPPTSVAVDGDAVWVLSGPSGTLSRIDSGSNTVTQTVRVAREAGGIAVFDGVVWVTAR